MQVKRYTTVGQQSYVAIVGEPERKYTPMVWINGRGVGLHKVSNRDAAHHCRDIKQGAKAPIKMAREMLRVGKRLGITKGAKKFLVKAIADEKAAIEELAGV